MSTSTLYCHIALSFTLSPIQNHQKTIITISKSTQLCRPALPYYTRLNHRKKPVVKVVRSSVDKDKVLDAKDAALLVNSCITLNLPPVLSLEQGLDRIKEAVEELQANPSPCSSGMYRFQLAVPPSAKALNWFCSQIEPSTVFPVFFLSNEKDNPTYKSVSLGRTRGVFGIGSAITFNGHSPHASEKYIAFDGYLPAEPTSPKAYGFLDVAFDTNSSLINHQSGSFHLFIPQIELDEFEDITFLIATLAWDDSSLCTIHEAFQSFELAFDQARHSCTTGTQLIPSSLSSFNKVDGHRQMVRVNALLLDEGHLEASSMELENASTCCSQFSVRLSPTLSLENDMHLRGEINQANYFSQDCPNINLTWASLIVEECTRLGLTYFCVAPGSRSSPLTLAAASHPRTTCIACIDERSLAFHALGYAKGSQKPAVIITSSGTAVSNLFPALCVNNGLEQNGSVKFQCFYLVKLLERNTSNDAMHIGSQQKRSLCIITRVVEASENFVPMLLLTADRPPELIDVGANQAINQVNHYGTFVRHFFSLPPPTDDISARMVLTTVDSAAFIATSSPKGPVHINCPFREPLAQSPRKWDHDCLNGLHVWMSNAAPFTRYIPLQQSLSSNNINGLITEVLSLIQGAFKGILVFGSIHNEDDIWAALLLAKHLQWPVVVDIQSGLRLRKYLSSFLDGRDILFVDQLDQLLLSDSVREWMCSDVVIQIGSRITGTHISQMIEHCSPCSYVLVDDHPGRHDPSHIMTHRILGPINEFCDIVIKCCAPCVGKKWKEILRGLDMMGAWETSFFINSEKSLTEPYVARKIFETVPCGSALFIGNSMPIRDADMYGTNWVQCTHSASLLFTSGLPCHFVQITGNRGANGIDGLISTAVGFAVGCNKRVLLVIGDISFLHDTNGLALLRQRTHRKPMVIVVVNNHGGAIFSQLPVASMTERSILDQFFYTSHNVSIRNLCLAHGVKHVQVQTKIELEDALFTTQREDVDCVVEVESGIDTNVAFRSNLRNFTRQASNDALNILSKLSRGSSTLQDDMHYKIVKMEYSLYRVQLKDRPTSASRNSNTCTSHREGFVISLTLEDGTVGLGEVAPLEIHQEKLYDVEEQLRFLIHAIEGKAINDVLVLLKGSVSAWIWNNLGVPEGSIFPSLRCGLEIAIFSVIANKHGRTLLDILHPSTQELPPKSSAVQICALIDSYRSPKETALVASALIEEGFTAIKIKVARGADPEEDISVIKEVRKKVGLHIVLRADANRKWTYDEAVKFACAVKDCRLQYIEEPVDNEDDIVKFFEETGLPVALDETINCIREQPLQVLEKFSHSGVVALVIKPGVIGGFEKTAWVARWAHQHGKMAVVSAAFESALGLSAYVQLACFLDLQHAEMQRLLNKEPLLPPAHGFGTYKWFKEEVTTEPLSIQYNPMHGFVEADAVESGKFLQKCNINPEMMVRTFVQEQVKEYPLVVDTGNACFSIKVLEVGESINGSIVMFLHGFLGTSEDWIPIMKTMSSSTKCVAIDLPGHGGSKLHHHHSDSISSRPNLSIDVVADIVCKVLNSLTPTKVTLVGYSMGARISLYTALKHSDKVERAVITSGSPGLIDNDARMKRKAKDDFRASALISHGLEFFTEAWYAEELWASLRSHPHFKQMVAKRVLHDDLHTLSKVLSDLSIGRQPSLWEDLKHCKVPLLLIAGEKDSKFKKIAHQMYDKIRHNSGVAAHSSMVVEVPSAGHAVHLENPLALVAALRKFLEGEKTT